MAKTINQEVCIQCGVCLPECPNGGISEVDGLYQIETRLCTECFGFAEESRCKEVCPVDAIEDDPNAQEEEAALAGRAAELRPDKFPRD